MNTTLASAAELVVALRDELARFVSGGREEVVLCPPYISLPRVAEPRPTRAWMR